MKSSKYLSFILIALVGLTVVPARAFTVDPPEQSRSSFVRLRGPGFGNVQGKVMIGKLPAPIAHWDDNLIECYVPEGAALGKSQVVVRPRQGLPQSKARMTVLPREELAGRFKWRLKLPDQYVTTRPVIAPDGTVYAMGNFGHIYSVNPDGTLRWVVSPAGGVSGCIGLLPNGNLVVGGGGGVQALSFVDGSTLWTFPLQTPLLTGPNVGPDGNIYSADDSRWSQSVIGAFILNANGQLVWSGGKYYRRGGGWTPQEVKFGGGNAYFWSDYSSTGDPDVLGGLNAIHLGGGLFWRVEDGVGIFPDAISNGNVALFRPSTIEMRNLSGTTIWSQNLNLFGGQPQLEAAVASDGITYFTTTNAQLHAISPTGQVLYSKSIGGIINYLSVRPDGNQLALQYQPNFGIAAQIQGYDKNASLLWSEELPVEFGMTIVCYQMMEYTPMGDTLYFGTAGPYTSTYEAQCYLYALDPQ